MTQGIQVKNLQSVASVNNTASFMALTDSVNNEVNLISKNNLSGSLVSSTANNGLTNDANGLYVVNTGELSNLTTTDKTSLVGAINEVHENSNPTVNVLPTSGTINLTDNSINTITPNGNVTFALPAVTDLTNFHQILVQVKLTSSYTINLGTSYYFNEETPTFSNHSYDIVYEYDNINTHWVVGSIIKG